MRAPGGHALPQNGWETITCTIAAPRLKALGPVELALAPCPVIILASAHSRLSSNVLHTLCNALCAVLQMRYMRCARCTVHCNTAATAYAFSTQCCCPPRASVELHVATLHPLHPLHPAPRMLRRCCTLHPAHFPLLAPSSDELPPPQTAEVGVCSKRDWPSESGWLMDPAQERIESIEGIESMVSTGLVDGPCTRECERCVSDV
jgi:hypothetical protein